MHSLVPNSNSVFKIASLVDLISSLMKLLSQNRVQAAINQVAFLMLYHVLSFHKLWKSSFTKCEIQEKQYFIEQEGKFSRRPAARSNAISSIVVVSISKHISSSEANVLPIAKHPTPTPSASCPPPPKFGGHLDPYFLRAAQRPKV